MQSEDLDKKIRDAAEHHHPAYNEAAWSKMENLLDKHLPREKKDNRRILFLLLFLLLLGGGAWILISKPWKGQQIVSKAGTGSNVPKENNTSTGKPGNSMSVPGNNAETSTPILDEVKTEGASKTGKNTNTGISPGTTNISTPGDYSITVNPASKSRKGKKVPGNVGTVVPGIPTDKPAEAINKREQSLPVINPNEDRTTRNKPGKDEVAGDPKTGEPTLNPQQTPSNNLPVLPADRHDTVTAKPIMGRDDTPLAVVPKEDEAKKKKDQKRKTSVRGFVFSLSAGPDISAAGLDDVGKVQPVYGVGLGYRLSEKFTLRTGMYVASKIYTASPSDYKPEYTPPNFNYLQKVDADCRVYEIPVTLAYQWGKGKHQWFTAAGVSSYLMKRETYDYLYKYPSGQTYSYRRTIDNENRHFLSAISLSGGYTRKLNNTFSVSAEPYIKIPVSGVGWGNINLQSGGVLFSINAFLPTTKNKK